MCLQIRMHCLKETVLPVEDRNSGKSTNVPLTHDVIGIVLAVLPTPALSEPFSVLGDKLQSVVGIVGVSSYNREYQRVLGEMWRGRGGWGSTWLQQGMGGLFPLMLAEGRLKAQDSKDVSWKEWSHFPSIVAYVMIFRCDLLNCVPAL